MAEVRLRAMTRAEFPAWRDAQIEGYAEDLLRNGRVSASLAPERDRTSFESALPDELDTPGHAVWIGEDPATGEEIGCLWLGPGEDPSVAWVFTVEVWEPFRGNGYGTALMQAFEEEARARGFAAVGLNVFAHNTVARHLYESLGYDEIARQMTKKL